MNQLRGRPPTGQAWRVVAAVGGLGCLVALLAAAWQLWPQAQANALAMAPLAQVRAWQAPRAKPPNLEQWLQTRAQLARALAKAPQDGELQEAMAYVYLSAALRPGQAPALQKPYLHQALQHLASATQARPMVPSAWASQALALHRLALLEPAQAATAAPAMWDALDRALAYGQREHGVQMAVGAVAWARWAELSPARRQAVQTMVAQATPRQQQALQHKARQHGLEPAQATP